MSQLRRGDRLGSFRPPLPVAGALLICMVGCATPSPRKAPVPPPSEPTAAPERTTTAVPTREVVEIGRSVDGRPIEAHVLGDGRDVTLILATIHGNEAAGTPLVQRLIAYLQSHPHLLAGRRAVVVPVANPDGLADGRRYNRRGVDLNRNFGAANHRAGRRGGRASLSEPESRAIHKAIFDYGPDRVVSLHQPVAVMDWDGPGEDLARAMGAACNLPAKRIGSRPGSLGSWVGVDLGLPIITFELPRNADGLSPDALWDRYGPALLVALQGKAARSRAANASTEG